MKQERGNILFVILIAIALFAALSYTMTQNSGSGNIDKEISIISVSQAIQYAGSISKAIGRMRSINGCLDTEISFDDSKTAGYINPNAPMDKSCHIFDINGGALNYKLPPVDFNDGSDWLFQGGPQIHGVGQTNFDASSADLVMLSFNLNENACAQINKSLGYGFSSIPIDDDSHTNTTKFIGIYALSEDINGLSAAPNPSPCPGGLCGKKTGCFREENAGQRYIFYHILRAR